MKTKAKEKNQGPQNVEEEFPYLFGVLPTEWMSDSTEYPIEVSGTDLDCIWAELRRVHEERRDLLAAAKAGQDALIHHAEGMTEPVARALEFLRDAIARVENAR